MRDEGQCHVCGEYGANEADHVVPLSEGGEDHIDNMKAIHSTPCHERKTQAEAQRARTGG
jgi:5-methylcytosine-specific restriction endonuclease McrA